MPAEENKKPHESSTHKCKYINEGRAIIETSGRFMFLVGSRIIAYHNEADP